MLLSVSTVRPEAQRFIAVMSAGDGPVVAVPEAALVDGGPIPNHDMVTADKTSHFAAKNRVAGRGTQPNRVFACTPRAPYHRTTGVERKKASTQ